MNRAWITGLTVASVAGTGGVAFATMNASTHGAEAKATPQAADTTVTVAPKVYSYQAGAAGQVNLTAAEGELNVDSVLPSAGWSVVSYSGSGAHVEVRLTDSIQIITFSADLVGGEVQAGITAAPVPTVATTAAPTTTPATPAPQPANPVVVLTPSAQSPSTAHTSSPSGSGSHQGDDDGHESDDEGGSDD